MLKIVLFLIIIVVSGCAGTGEKHTLGMFGMATFQNEPDGFRGIKWGQDISEISGMQLVIQDDEGLKTYVRPGDQLTLGDAKLKSIQYLFWRGKFLEVQMRAAPGELQALKNVLKEKYEDGYNLYGPFSPIIDYSWAGPVAFVGLQRRVFNKDCEVWIKSREINDQRIVFRGQKAKKGAELGAQKDF